MGAAPGRVAAFFDIDGTLVPSPSLERRFLTFLLWRRELSLANALRWIGQAMRLAPRGASAMRHANKMYLRGLRVSLDEDGGLRFVLPGFFRQALECVARHAAAGHEIVLVSGTLAPLAEMLRRKLEATLDACGYPARIRVCATQLEKLHGAWTGRVLGEPVMGQAKGQAALRLAGEFGYDLAHCYAYADSASDRSMLAAVGNPAAVNPTRRLARIARANGWPILRWSSSRSAEAKQHGAGGCGEMSLCRRLGKTT
jgi:HAD superfamily hydrolase (TIGR01490 family)